MNRIVDTPIRLEVTENLISFDESNTITEVMENNSYQVKIHTNEFLDGCQLVMKRYGDPPKNSDNTGNELIVVDDNLNFETIRIITIDKLKINNNEEEVQYWGTLRLYNDWESSPNTSEGDSNTLYDEYLAELYEYYTQETDGEVPGKKKISMVNIRKVGEVTGHFEKKENGSNVSNEIEYDFILENCIIDGNEVSDVVFSIHKKTDQIPNPPMIDGELILPSSIKFNHEFTYDFSFIENSENTPNVSGSCIFNFKNFELPYSFYDEQEGYYYFEKTISFTDIVPTETTESTEKMAKLFDNENSSLELRKVTFGQEIDKYIRVSGEKKISLKFFKNNFAIYELEIDGNLTFVFDGQVPKKSADGKFLYNIPKKQFATTIIYKPQRDGTGEKKSEKIYPLVYETLSDNSLVYDKNGLKIPVFKTKRVLSLDESGDAILKLSPKDGVKRLKYKTDSSGNIIYEEKTIPKFERDKNGKIIVDEETGLAKYLYINETEIDYEKHYNGDYIYISVPSPVYILDENGEKQIENGKYLVEYERDGNGDIIIDDNVLEVLYETTETGSFILDENELKIPIYETEIGFDLDENGNVIQETETQEKDSYIIKYEKDSSGNIIYENRLIPKFERDENGKIIIDENEKAKYLYDSNNEIQYEKHFDGAYVYNRVPTPIYSLDDNDELQIENGEYLVEYETDGTGEYIKDENGNYKFTDVPEQIELIDENGKSVKVDRYEITGFSTLKGEDGNVIYEPQELDSNLLLQYEEKEIYGIKYYVLKDKNDQPIYTFERDKENNYDIVLDGNNNPKPYYGKAIITNEDGISENYENQAPSDETKKIIELKPVTDGSGDFIYQTDENGEKIIIPDSKEVLEDGEVEISIKMEDFILNQDETIDIAYDGFDYNKQLVSKETLITEDLEENNIYTAKLDGKYLPNYSEKFFLGLRKIEKEEKEDEQTTYQTTYATDAVELKVIRSIETITWEPENEYNNQKYVIANYDNTLNLFYELSSTSDNPQYLAGKEKIIYINNNKLTNNDLEENLVFKWNPEIGFYSVDSTNQIGITN